LGVRQSDKVDLPLLVAPFARYVVAMGLV